MAKVFAPLHSLAASGSIGKVISFRATSKGAVVTSKPQPYRQSSPAMLENQQRMIDARATFKALSAADRNHWNALATARGRTPWFSFFTEYQIQFIQAPGAPLIPAPFL